MGRKRNPTPTLDRSNGYVRARWTTDAGRQTAYLGPEARPQEWKAELARLTARLAADPNAPARPRGEGLVTDLVEDYLRSGDVPPGKAGQHRRALLLLLDHCAGLPVAEFGPRALEAWRDALCARRPAYTVTYVRMLLAAVRRCWAWAVRRELVPPDRLVALRTVPGPAPGRAAPARVVGAADDAAVAAALPFLRPPVRAMVELQRLTGARPSELFRLAPADVLRAGRVRLPGVGEADLDALGVWAVAPAGHKTAGRGKGRWLAIGPKAQAVLAPFLDGRPAAAPCFSPRDVKGGTAGERYTRHSYRQAVRRACDRAGVPPVNPYQIRHRFGEATDAELGLDATQHAMGHASAQTTRRYAKLSFATAARVAAAVG